MENQQRKSYPVEFKGFRTRLSSTCGPSLFKRFSAHPLVFKPPTHEFPQHHPLQNHTQTPMALSASLRYRHLLLFLCLFLRPPPCPAASGSWAFLNANIGISAMHMQLLPNNRVVMFDRTNFGTSNISLPKCLPNNPDCSAHAVEYDIASNTIRPTTVLSDVWCSSGTLMPDGTLSQTGGNGAGFRTVRKFKPCGNCDWEEIPNGLAENRWYATDHVLPDGRQIVIGGRGAFNYEFVPKASPTEKAINFPFLAQTNDQGLENNLYPFVFLNPDGHLFVYANNRAILFDYVGNKVVRTYPIMPGGQPRSYPSTGSAVLLPLHIVQGNVGAVEVLVCGGAPKGSLVDALNGKFNGALDDCGRIKISDPNPQWVMEPMPMARVMSDMLLLPNGHVLIINGVSAGVAGWDLGRNPVLSPVIYRPDNPFRRRFEVQTPTMIPRVYHSTAILLPDCRVLVGGSNAHEKYQFANTLYPTELSLEAFSPSYLDRTAAGLRPHIILPKTRTTIHYGKPVLIRFTISGPVDPNMVMVTMAPPAFATHSFSMNQRLLVLDGGNTAKLVGKANYEVVVTAPPNGNIAPAGYYMLFVVQKKIPGPGIWIKIQ